MWLLHIWVLVVGSTETLLLRNLCSSVSHSSCDSIDVPYTPAVNINNNHLTLSLIVILCAREKDCVILNCGFWFQCTCLERSSSQFRRSHAYTYNLHHCSCSDSYCTVYRIAGIFRGYKNVRGFRGLGTNREH